MLDNSPEYAKEIAGLYSWSLNFDPGKGPFTLFLDLIGWSEDNIGEPLYDLTMAARGLGYVEIDKLANALKEFTINPIDTRQWVNSIMQAETEE